MARSRRQDAGLLVLRAGTGGVLFAHGAQILFGWFGGPGLGRVFRIFVDQAASSDAVHRKAEYLARTGSYSRDATTQRGAVAGGAAPRRSERHGLTAASVGMERMGFRPGRPSALLAGGSQLAGGTLLAAGLATPVAGAVAAGAMAGAVAVHTPGGFFSVSGGYEFPALLGWTAAALGIAGPGRYSADHLTGHRLNRPRTARLAFLATAALTAAVLRRRAARLPHGPEEPTP
ncbi:DoxX family protein [Streptomyces ginkgonis]|uniref:DoxX family protein n=1 Tax=Streptomyces ginkgonis TaxID=1812259 RepID=UPI002176A1BA|nr:DoxX family protein [Streptomyces ginkgonis]